MDPFRCLIFDQDDKVCEVVQLEADSVADALAKAQQIRSSRGAPVIEVWCRGKIVGRLRFTH